MREVAAGADGAAWAMSMVPASTGAGSSTVGHPARGRYRPGMACRITELVLDARDPESGRPLFADAFATAEGAGRSRNVVARLRLEQLSESIPQTAVVAGALIDAGRIRFPAGCGRRIRFTGRSRPTIVRSGR